MMHARASTPFAVVYAHQVSSFNGTDSPSKLTVWHCTRPKVGDPIPNGKPNQVAISTAEAEAAEGLCTWTVATLCRSLTLPNILTLLTGVLCNALSVVLALVVITPEPISVHDIAPPYHFTTLLIILVAAAAVLLERQTVVFSPNVGVLTSVVLSMIPLVRPFAWQSLLLPVLPCTEDMLDLLQVGCCS
jgi:DENN (AEX-3) domain